MGHEGQEYFLSPSESEAHVSGLTATGIFELGSLNWLKKSHKVIQELTGQACIESHNNQEEYVKRLFLLYDKVPVIIHDVILIELWTEKIFPKLLEQNANDGNGNFPIYSILFHEGLCVNLLEAIAFDGDALETCNDEILDLLDYSHRTTLKLLTMSVKANNNELEERSFQEQCKEIFFATGLKALKCFCLVIENLEKLKCDVTGRLINKFDAPMLLVDVILNKPWRKMSSSPTGEIEMEYKATIQKWVKVSPEDAFCEGDVEPHVWLSLYMILTSQGFMNSYELNHMRKSQLMKLSPLLNEMLVDKLVFLKTLQHWLLQLPLQQAGCVKPPLLIELVSPILNSLSTEFIDKYEQLVEHYENELLTCDVNTMIQKAKVLDQSYDQTKLKDFLPKPGRCGFCNETAIHRCSRCMSVYYCNKECQRSHWRVHKHVCKQAAE